MAAKAPSNGRGPLLQFNHLNPSYLSANSASNTASPPYTIIPFCTA